MVMNNTSTQTTKPKFKAAVVQAAPVFLDLSGGVEKACSLISNAAEQGAELIVFPELWLPGYPLWIWFTPPLMGMMSHANYLNNSMAVGDLHFQKICDTAKENNIHVVMGFSEKAGSSLYISQAFIDRDGNLLSTRRKLKYTLPERMMFAEGDGSGLQVHDLDIGKLGALNCWENTQPLNKYAMFSLGEQIHAASWPAISTPPGTPYQLSSELTTGINQNYAFEGQCFVLMATAVMDEGMVEMLVTSDEMAKFFQVGGGHSNIFGPDGRSLVEKLPENEEGLLIADIDLSQIVAAKWLIDPVGHYARPDVTHLLLNTEPAPVVQPMSATSAAVDVGQTTQEDDEEELQV